MTRKLQRPTVLIIGLNKLVCIRIISDGAVYGVKFDRFTAANCQIAQEDKF